MSWVSQNKFLTGFGAVMLVGVGTLGWLTYSAMDKYDGDSGATRTFDAASAELNRLQNAKPSLTQKNLTELLAQKQQLTEKIGEFQTELKARVLPLAGGTIEPAQFQDKLKDAVAQIATKIAQSKIEPPKNFYLGFDKYQATPPPKNAAPALARELRAIELVMDVLIQAGKIDGLEINEFQRDPLPEEGVSKLDDAQGGSGRKKNAAARSDHGSVQRHGLVIKTTSSDAGLRKILTGLANHKQQLFVIRNVTLQNKQGDSPQRVAAAFPLTPAPEQPAIAPAADVSPAAVTPPAAVASPVAAPVLAAAPAVNEGPLAYIFGTEKIVSVIELEVLNIEEPSSKPEKGEKKKNKEK